MKQERPEGYTTGRPTKYKPEYCQMVIDWMSEGWALVEICLELKVAKSTLQEWAKQHPEFSAALSRGTDLSEGWWVKTSRNALWDKDFNDRLWYRNMANRFGWRDKVESNVTATVKQEDALKELG